MVLIVTYLLMVVRSFGRLGVVLTELQMHRTHLMGVVSLVIPLPTLRQALTNLLGNELLYRVSSYLNENGMKFDWARKELNYSHQPYEGIDFLKKLMETSAFLGLLKQDAA